MQAQFTFLKPGEVRRNSLAEMRDVGLPKSIRSKWTGIVMQNFKQPSGHNKRNGPRASHQCHSSLKSMLMERAQIGKDTLEVSNHVRSDTLPIPHWQSFAYQNILTQASTHLLPLSFIFFWLIFIECLCYIWHWNLNTSMKEIKCFFTYK